MNFPDDANIKGMDYKANSISDLLITAWCQAAIKAGLETGIFVDVEFEYFQSPHPYIKRIFFKFLDKECEDETTLKRMLKLKAFL
jgi:hypothetical protein